MKGVRIRSFSGPYFLAFRLNTDQKNSEYRHFLCCDQFAVITIFSVNVWTGKCKGESELESEQVRVKMKSSFCLGVFINSVIVLLYEKGLNTKRVEIHNFLWSIFSHSLIEYGELWAKPLYSVIFSCSRSPFPCFTKKTRLLSPKL